MPKLSSKKTNQIRHARYLQRDRVYHVISKTLRGQFLLAPKKGVSALCAGVVAKARQNWPEVRLYGFAFMSNHIHLMLSGHGNEVSAFVGFIKREISRRLGQRYSLPGTFWHQRFAATALPTAESQVKCLKYILSQGVKEDLVERPEHWPGLHCVKSMMTGRKIKAEWFQSTEYYRAKMNHNRLLKKKRLKREDFFEKLDLRIDSLPAWSHLSALERRTLVSDLVADIVAEAQERRLQKSKKILGRKAVRQVSIRAKAKPAAPPWWRDRRRQITAWAKRCAEATRAYVEAYWRFQRSYGEAAGALRESDWDNGFPVRCWLPSTYNR